MNTFNTDTAKRFWSFVKEHDREMMVVLKDHNTKLVAYFEPTRSALDMFIDDYVPDGEITIPASLIFPGAVRVEINRKTLLMASDDRPITAMDIWNERPTDFTFRTEW